MKSVALALAFTLSVAAALNSEVPAAAAEAASFRGQTVTS